MGGGGPPKIKCLNLQHTLQQLICYKLQNYMMSPWSRPADTHHWVHTPTMLGWSDSSLAPGSQKISLEPD